jgi:hypothetical protein
MLATSLSQHARQSRHSLFCCGAGHICELVGMVRACTVEVLRNRFGLGPSTIAADTLTIKLSGSVPV